MTSVSSSPDAAPEMQGVEALPAEFTAEQQDFDAFVEAERQREKRQDEAEAKAGPDELDKALDGLSKVSSAAEIKRVLRQIAAIDDAFDRERALTRVVKATGVGKKLLMEQIKEIWKRADAEPGDEDVAPAPVKKAPPKDLTKITRIWLDWGHKTVIEAAVARMVQINAADPQIFRLPDGSVVQLLRGVDQIKFIPMRPENWSAYIQQTLEFWQTSPTGEETSVAPPAYVVALFSGGRYEWPFLRSFSRVPIYDRAGNIVSKAGYDAASQLFIDPDNEYQVPRAEELTDADVEWAKEMLLSEAMVDFPFSDLFDGSEVADIYSDEPGYDSHPVPNWDRGRGSRANAMAMIIQPFVREIIKGPTPVYVIVKPAAGSGSGYLLDVVSYAFIGERAPLSPYADNPDEVRKMITANLIEGQPLLFLDNINVHVDSGFLALALTSGKWRDRVLGVSATAGIEIRSLWAMTGNNLTLSHELMRRVVPIMLDANVDKPALNRPSGMFKHFPIHPWLEVVRTDLALAIYVLVENWKRNGRPAGGVTMHSFDSWADVLGGILVAAGIEGFMTNQKAYLDMNDEEGVSYGQLVELLWERFGDHTAFTAAQAYECLKDPTSMRVDVIPLNGKDEDGWVKSLGQQLAKKVVGGTYRFGPDDASLTVKLRRNRVTKGTEYKFFRLG